MISARDGSNTVPRRPAAPGARLVCALSLFVAVLLGAATAAHAQDGTVVIGGTDRAGNGSVTVDLSVLQNVPQAPEEDRLLFPGSRIQPGQPVRLHRPRGNVRLRSPAPRIRLRRPAKRRHAAPRTSVASRSLRAPRPASKHRASKPILKPPPRPRRARSKPVEVTPPSPPPEASAMAAPKASEIPAPPMVAPPRREPKAAAKNAAPPPLKAAPSTRVARKTLPPPRTPRPEPKPAPVMAEPAPPPPPAPEAMKPAQASAPAAESQTASLPPPAPKAAPVFDIGSTHSIAFDSGSAAISKDGENTLSALAAALEKDKQLRLELRAYAQASGNNVSRARRLSLSRALAIRAYLIKKGVRSTRIDVRALGNKVPEGPADRVDLSVRTR